MSANADADRAIAELNGRELDGRALNVNEARPKTERSFGGGGGGGGKRGGNKRW
jgi:RNA recognition motif-containing protein